METRANYVLVGSFVLGITAMLVTTVPLWIVLLDWLRPGGVRPSGRIIAGMLAGFAGIALLYGRYPH